MARRNNSSASAALQPFDDHAGSDGNDMPTLRAATGLSVEQRAQIDQIAVVAAAMKSTTVIGSVIAVVAVACTAANDGTTRLLFASLSLWCGAILIVNLGRYGLAHLIERKKLDRYSLTTLLRVSALTALLSGIAWSLLFVITYDNKASSQFFMLIGSGVAAGAVVQGRHHALAVIAFVLPMQGPMFWTFVEEGRTDSYFAAGAVAVFCIMLIRSSIESERHFLKTMRLKHEADDLAAEVISTKDALYQANVRLSVAAKQDPLTQLMNRSAFDAACADAADRTDYAILMLDLDGFKLINDTFGHVCGDVVLVEIAARLRRSLDVGECAARLGGDEFAILATQGLADEALIQRATKLLRELHEPIAFANRSLSVGASAGIAKHSRGKQLSHVRQNADLALYAAKRTGRGCVRVYDSDLEAYAAARRLFSTEIKDAIQGERLEVWFQPHVRIPDGGLCGFEALIRWKHEAYGWVPPPQLIEAALEVGASELLMKFILKECCAFSSELRSAGTEELLISFNVSPRELRHYDLASTVQFVLERHSAPMSAFMIEVTEEAVLSRELSTSTIASLAALGMKIAVDDFGVSCSTFDTLRKADFHALKIDKSFIAGIVSDPKELQMLQALIGAAKCLGLEVIAEGVETRDQAHLLKLLGCDKAQGFHYGRPRPAKHWIESIRSHMKPFGVDGGRIAG